MSQKCCFNGHFLALLASKWPRNTLSEKRNWFAKQLRTILYFGIYTFGPPQTGNIKTLKTKYVFKWFYMLPTQLPCKKISVWFVVIPDLQLVILAIHSLCWFSCSFSSEDSVIPPAIFFRHSRFDSWPWENRKRKWNKCSYSGQPVVVVGMGSAPAEHGKQLQLRMHSTVKLHSL